MRRPRPSRKKYLTNQTADLLLGECLGVPNCRLEQPGFFALDLNGSWFADVVERLWKQIDECAHWRFPRRSTLVPPFSNFLLFLPKTQLESFIDLYGAWPCGRFIALYVVTGQGSQHRTS